MTERPKILIVDDNISNIYLVEEILADLDVETVRALSGKEAVEKTSSQEFALVLMDISMPEMDGFETVELIRGNKENELLNVIYITALYDEPFYRVRGIKTGAVDFMTKPIIPELLIGKINIFVNLYKQRKRLEFEIRQRMEIEKELIAAREIAEDAALAKQQFLSNMSHEIRTPLNAIVNITHLLSEEQPREDQLDNLDILRFSARNLLQLINSVLDYSKIDSGKIEFESAEFDFRKQINALYQSLEPEASLKGLKMELRMGENVPPVLRGDASRLSQILLNLLSNAIKFTEQGQVSLEIKVINELADASEILFRVIDTGIGIPAGMEQKIFEKFIQASPATSRNYGGTGLGLAITRMLVELQGGRIHVESKQNQGSTFTFFLRFGKSNKTSIREAELVPVEYHSLKGLKVLVAEDNVVNQKIALKLLAKWEAVADLAENGEIAVEKIRNNRYNLVLMDLHMPEMNGYEATINVRKMEGQYYRDLPILAVTATAFAEERSKIRSSGMNGYIIKPFTPPELYSRISRFVM